MTTGRRLAASRLTRHAARNFFGREPELELLDQAWANPRIHVLSIVAWGGVGKTSLVTQWIATRMAAVDWPGVERYFDWSFYSQGTGDSRQTSADLFIHDALRFFGDPDPVKGSPWERGERLAGLVRQHRTLLVLDGIEPLQYPPTDRSGQAGRLKDQALEALLQSLVQEHNGLCILTTREHLSNIDSYPTQQELKLDKLPLPAAIGLIRHLQLTGTDQEIEELWDALDGHALSLLQLGRLLARGYGHDLRKWREIGFSQADKSKQGRSTMRVMAQYESWLAAGDQEQQLELAILRLMGLFEKPMSPGCFAALRAPPVIENLTELFSGVEDFEIESAARTLIDNELLSHSGGDGHSDLLPSLTLDAHPLIREYFAEKLKRDQPEAFRAAHSRLFDYLCVTTEPHLPDGIDGIAPLYQAITHGCLAERHQEALYKVYVERILRGTGSNGFYSTRKLGAIGADLQAVAAFFLKPWTEISPKVASSDQAWLLNQAAVRLRSMGRVLEAAELVEESLKICEKLGDWPEAAIRAGNLCELQVTQGRLPQAIAYGWRAIEFSDRDTSEFIRLVRRTNLADALHQAGRRSESEALFIQAERMQAAWRPQLRFLVSLRGFQFADLLLSDAERTAWQLFDSSDVDISEYSSLKSSITACLDVEQRAKAALDYSNRRELLLDIALDHLTQTRAILYRSLLTGADTSDIEHLKVEIDTTLSKLRLANVSVFLPRALLTAAFFYFRFGSSPEKSKKLIDEAQRIAERGPMPLDLADVHLHRARMFRDKSELEKAGKLIRNLGYGRRYEELADAEAALANDTTAQIVLDSKTRTAQPPHYSSAAGQMASMTTTKTVLELDLVGYSDKARELEEHLGVDLVMRFNDQIKGFISQGLAATGLNEADTIVQSTGDGAIVILDTAEQAHRFAEAVNKATLEYNQRKTLESARRWFRIAAAAGEIQIRGKDLAGTTIANAVRLESAGEAGHFLIDLPTWNALPAALQALYLPVESIRGKREELFPARRCVFNSAPRPDHVELTLQLKRSEFTDLAAKSFLRELAGVLGVDPASIGLEGIRDGSTVVRLRFRNSDALAEFIRGHIEGDGKLKAFFEEWNVNAVTYHAGVKSTHLQQTEQVNEDDFLAVLKKLPSAWFEEVVFKFDRNGAVPQVSGQAVRAIELLKVIRITDPTFQVALDFIAHLTK
ncbi:MAG: hypothetical protein MUE46_01610 [Xanthomonadales bacterium]|jgi:tetratricopeptide (TPR) repeat protein|nr:hypothetical protein [Xanthomonadales bacterium]